MFKDMIIKLLLVSMGLSHSLLLAKSKSSEKKPHQVHTDEQKGNEQRFSITTVPSASYSSLTINTNEKVGGDLIVNGSAATGNLLKAKNGSASSTVKVGNDCIKGSLSVSDCSSINENLVVGKALTTKCIQAENVSACKESCGSLICDKNDTGQLKVVHNAQVGSTVTLNNISSLRNNATNFGGDVGICKYKLLVNEINPVDSLGQEDDNGVTCFSGDVGIHPGQKLLVNEINPVSLDSDGKCIINDDGITCFSGNVALDPVFTHTLFVNEINPVTMDENGNCFPNDNGTTCFSGNVGIHPNRVLIVNEIDPVIVDADCNCCTEDPNPCATTNFSGALNIGTIIEPPLPRTKDKTKKSTNKKLSRFSSSENPGFGLSNLYGELSQDINGQPINMYYDQNNMLNLGYPTTVPTPVLRIFLNLTDQNIDFQDAQFRQKFYPFGAWVKLDVFGMAQLNGFIEEQNQEPYDATFNFDVYTELYFFIGANGHSQLVGTLNGHLFNNTLSSSLSVNYPNLYKVLMRNRAPSAFTFPDSGLLSYNYFQNEPNNLFGMVPTAADVLSPITILGIPYSCTPIGDFGTNHGIVDIALIGLLQLPKSFLYNYNNNEIILNDGSRFIFNGSNALNINSLTVCYQVISPNLPMNILDTSNKSTVFINQPPCIPDQQIDDCILGNMYNFFNQFVDYGNIQYRPSPIPQP